MGLRAGLQLSIFQRGAEFSSSQVQFDAKSSADALNYDDSKGTMTQMGAFLGLKISSFRVLLGYSFNDELVLKDSPRKNTYTGKAAKFGLGFNLVSALWLNFEVIGHGYDTFKDNTNNVRAKLPGVIDSSAMGIGTLPLDRLKMTSYQVTLSLPF